MTTKTFTKRDSATAALRKLGIKARDYNFFITQNNSREFEVDLASAQEHLEKLLGADKAAELATFSGTEPYTPADHTPIATVKHLNEVAEAADKVTAEVVSKFVAVKSKKPKAQVPAATSTDEAPGPGETTASYARRMLVDGRKTNTELWNLLVLHFGLDIKKRGYPAWYRWTLEKKLGIKIGR